MDADNDGDESLDLLMDLLEDEDESHQDSLSPKEGTAAEPAQITATAPSPPKEAKAEQAADSVGSTVNEAEDDPDEIGASCIA